MKLYSRAEKKDAEKILEGVKAAYGNPNPAKTHGFAGTFLFSPGDVYLSDRIWDCTGRHRKWEEFIDSCITRFYREDYGDISSRDKWENTENRYFGNGSYMFARYCFEDACIKMRTYCGFAYICEDSDFDLPEDTTREQMQMMCDNP